MLGLRKLRLLFRPRELQEGENQMRPIPEFTGANGYPVRHEPYYVTIPLGEWEDMTDELKRLREKNAELRGILNGIKEAK